MSITAAIAVAVSLGQNMYWKDTGEPDGGRATFVGRHGSMKPEGRRKTITALGGERDTFNRAAGGRWIGVIKCVPEKQKRCRSTT